MAQSFGRSLVEQLRAGEDAQFQRMMALQQQLQQTRAFEFSKQQHADTMAQNEARERAAEARALREDARLEREEQNRIRDDERAQIKLGEDTFDAQRKRGMSLDFALKKAESVRGKPYSKEETENLTKAEVARGIREGYIKPTKQITEWISKPAAPKKVPLEMWGGPGMDLLGAITGSAPQPDVMMPQTRDIPRSPQELTEEALTLPDPEFMEKAKKARELERHQKAVEGIRMTHEKTLAERAKVYSDKVAEDKVFHAATTAFRTTANELKGRLVTLKEEWQKQILPMQGKLIQARTASEKNRAANMAMGKLDIHYRPIAAMYNRFNKWEGDTMRDLLEAQAVVGTAERPLPEPQAPVRRTAAGPVEDNYDPAYLRAVDRYVKMTAQRDAAQQFIDQLHADEDYIAVMGAENPQTNQREGGLWEEVSGLREMMGKKPVPTVTTVTPTAKGGVVYQGQGYVVRKK